MMAFLGMMVQELGITFPGSMTLDGPAPVSYTHLTLPTNREV